MGGGALLIFIWSTMWKITSVLIFYVEATFENYEHWERSDLRGIVVDRALEIKNIGDSMDP